MRLPRGRRGQDVVSQSNRVLTEAICASIHAIRMSVSLWEFATRSFMSRTTMYHAIHAPSILESDFMRGYCHGLGGGVRVT